MSSLNLDLDYFDHPKTRGLVGLLGRGAEVMPLKLWTYCGKYYAEGGRLSAHGVQEIESIVGWWGKPGEAVKGMLKVNFLDHDADGYFVHDWTEHQGHIHALRKRAKHAAEVRWSSLEHAPGMLDASGKQCPTSAKPSRQNIPRESATDVFRKKLKRGSK